MVLWCDCVLLRALHIGVLGSVTSGKAELDGSEGVIVYDRFGTPNEYISGNRLRNWTVFRDMPEDAAPLPNLPFTYRSGIGFLY